MKGEHIEWKDAKVGQILYCSDEKHMKLSDDKYYNYFSDVTGTDKGYTWYTCKEPKTKVKRWLWAWNDSVHAILCSYGMPEMFTDEEAATEAGKNRDELVKLLWSETEFDCD